MLIEVTRNTEVIVGAIVVDGRTIFSWEIPIDEQTPGENDWRPWAANRTRREYIDACREMIRMARVARLS